MPGVFGERSEIITALYDEAQHDDGAATRDAVTRAGCFGDGYFAAWMSLLPSHLLRWLTSTIAVPALFATLPRSVKMPCILVILRWFVHSGRKVWKGSMMSRARVCAITSNSSCSLYAKRCSNSPLHANRCGTPPALTKRFSDEKATLSSFVR